MADKSKTIANLHLASAVTANMLFVAYNPDAATANQDTVRMLSNTVFSYVLGSNNTWTNFNLFNANVTVNATAIFTGGISANGSLGSDAQVLTSNGTVAYWANSTGSSSSVAEIHPFMLMGA